MRNWKVLAFPALIAALLSVPCSARPGLCQYLSSCSVRGDDARKKISKKLV
jgi:hypothetical protein